MAIGFRVRHADGSIMFDASSIPSAIIDVIDATAGVGGSRSYPTLVGRTISTNTLSGSVVFDYSDGTASVSSVRAAPVVSYPAGVPTVTWTYTLGVGSDVFINTTILVFVK